MTSGTNTYQGVGVTPNITVATVVKLGAARIQRVQVIVAGSAAGAVYDAPSVNGITVNGTTTANGVTNQVGVIPNAVGSYLIDMPCGLGVCVVPGAGQTVAVSYD